ncbi:MULTISPECIES: hypothetical protein [unclassified Microcoleus]|uniref:hypothetical protein n=1 Tax=unclassified Microcoleus TaxID=2642155 RepID=UPI0025CBFFF6|nr:MULTISPECIES: hypothetical protein [unclassified Microcoleus]
MTLWIFDTDHATLFGQGNPQIVQRVSAVNSKDIAITIVTFEEQMYGRLNRIRRATSGDEVISAVFLYYINCNLEDNKNEAKFQ